MDSYNISKFVVYNFSCVKEEARSPYIRYSCISNMKFITLVM